MASLMSFRPFSAARYRRSHIQDQSLASHAAFCLDVRSNSFLLLQPASYGQRSLASIIPRGIPVSGPSPLNINNSSGGIAGQVTVELMNSMRTKICEALETDICTVTDVYGDGRHVSIDVVSKLFVDQNSMKRQRMVFKVGEELAE